MATAFVLVLTSASAHAAKLKRLATDGTWRLNPGSGDFNTAANWTSAAVPDDTATFDQSNTTALTFSAGTAVDTLLFNAGAPAYTFNLSGHSLSLAGPGVSNNSSNAPTINAFGLLQFSNLSAAGNAIIKNTPGATSFLDSSSAGNAAVTNSSGGILSFTDTSTAGSATITTNSSSLAQFTTNSTGGNAQLIANAGGTVDFSGTAGPGNDNRVAAGSIAGAGNFFLGAEELTVGSNGLSTTVTGLIDDGGSFGGTGGSLVKTGAGTLTLGGTDTYTGKTTINAGTFSVTGSTTSPVTVNPGGTLAGTGTIGGDVTVQPGGQFAPGTSLGTLNIAGSMTWHGSAGAATALFELSNSNSTSDRLAITGALTRGAGPTFRFDFLGTGHAAVYTLATFSSTTFSASDFSLVNLAPGFIGSFAIVGGTTLQLTVSQIQLPSGGSIPTLGAWSLFLMALLLALSALRLLQTGPTI